MPSARFIPVQESTIMCLNNLNDKVMKSAKAATSKQPAQHSPSPSSYKGEYKAELEAGKASESWSALIAEFASDGSVNLALKMKGDMIVENLNLKPMIDAMMRDF
nr:hypothetical protein [Tanacetum cinerariifolium]